MVGAEFLGMMMLIVYVGAVAVLFLFVVMIMNVSEQKLSWLRGSRKTNHSYRPSYKSYNFTRINRSCRRMEI